MAQGNQHRTLKVKIITAEAGNPYSKNRNKNGTNNYNITV